VLCPTRYALGNDATNVVFNTADLWARPQENCAMHKPRSVKYVAKVAQISGIVDSFNRGFFFTWGYTNVLLWAKIVHVSGMFIYPVVHLSGVV